jgi:hypothetical protein
MSQLSRPSQDVSNSGWTPASGLSALLNEPVADDGSFTFSSNDPQGDAFEVKLAALAWPEAGPQTLTVRLRQSAAGTAKVYLALLQGSQIIAARTVIPTQSFANWGMTLTPDEAARISDYTDLRLRVIAGASVAVPCCPDTLLPALVTAHITAQTGDSACLPDTLPLATYPSGWMYTGPLCGLPGDATCDCLAGTGFYLGIFNNACAFVWGNLAVSTSCDPFQLIFDTTCQAPCVGSATVTIEEPNAADPL